MARLQTRSVCLLLALVWLLATLLVSSTPPAHGGESPYPNDYRPPVDDPVVDPFRPPAHVGAPGNRGLAYSPGAGTPVRAAKGGRVSFAGQVGGSLHVTVVHSDGLRTSYSYLAVVAVENDQVVGPGEVIGISGTDFHFGARAGDTYIDPALLFGESRGRARLVSQRPTDELAPAQLPIVSSGLIEWAKPTGTPPVGSASWQAPLRHVGDLAIHFRSGSGPWLEP